MDDYSAFQRLKLVCKRFRDIFQQQEKLFSLLFLRQHLKVQALPGLLHWLQRHSRDVSFVRSLSAGPCLDGGLVSLIITQKLTR